MTLDELFNNAKNGTQDAGYEEGHVSHRKNGDFIKQGGTWVPMKGQKQEGAEKTEAGADEQTMRQSLINFMTKGAPHTTEADAKKAVENLDPETLNQMFEGLKEQHGDKFLAKQEEAAAEFKYPKLIGVKEADAISKAEEAGMVKIGGSTSPDGKSNKEYFEAPDGSLYELTIENGKVARTATTSASTEADKESLEKMKAEIKETETGRKGPYPNGWQDGDVDAVFEYAKRNFPRLDLNKRTFQEMAKNKPDEFNSWMRDVHEEEKRSHEGDDTLASTFEAAKNNGWEETQMASGKLWDSPDGKQRIVERKDPESGESKYVLRPKSASDPAPDKSFNSLEEAFEAAKNGGEAPAHKAVDNTTGSNFKEGQRVPNAGALEKTYKHREKQYLDAHRKEAEAHPKEVTERREILASLVANARKQAAMFDAVNGMGDGEGQEWEINSHVAESLNKLNQEEKTLQAKFDELKNPKENKSESRKITPPKIDDIKGYGMEGADKKFYDAGFKPNGWDEEKRISKWKSPDGQEYGIHLDKFGYADEIIKLKTTGGKRDISAENRAYHERVEKERAERKASAQQSAQTAAQEAKQKGYTGETLKDFMLSKTYEGSSVSVTQRGMEAQGWSLTKGEDGLNVYEKPDGSKVTMQLEGNKVKSAEYQPAGSTENSATKLKGQKLNEVTTTYGDGSKQVYKITGGENDVANEFFRTHGQRFSFMDTDVNVDKYVKPIDKNSFELKLWNRGNTAKGLYGKLAPSNNNTDDRYIVTKTKDGWEMKQTYRGNYGGTGAFEKSYKLDNNQFSRDEAPLITAQSVNGPREKMERKLTGDCKVKLSKIKR